MERRAFFGLLPFLGIPATFMKKEEEKPKTLEDKVVKATQTLEDKIVKATQITVLDSNGEQYHLLAVKKDEEMNTISIKPAEFGVCK